MIPTKPMSPLTATTAAVPQEIDEFKSPVFADRRLAEAGEYHYYQAIYHQKNCVGYQAVVRGRTPW